MHNNIRNQICNHSDDLIQPEKIETEKILTDKKIFQDLVIYFTDMLTISQKNVKSAFS